MITFKTVCCVCGEVMSEKFIEGEAKVLLSHGYCAACGLELKAELAEFKRKLERGELCIG